MRRGKAPFEEMMEPNLVISWAVACWIVGMTCVWLLEYAGKAAARVRDRWGYRDVPEEHCIEVVEQDPERFAGALRTRADRAEADGALFPEDGEQDVPKTLEEYGLGRQPIGTELWALLNAAAEPYAFFLSREDAYSCAAALGSAVRMVVPAAVTARGIVSADGAMQHVDLDNLIAAVPAVVWASPAQEEGLS